MLLGFGVGPRTDRTLALPPGSSVLIYTDGLVERRGSPLDDGFAWLADVARQGAGLGPDALADHVLAALGGLVEDDVALLVLRIDPA